jgi:hypothetical protein
MILKSYRNWRRRHLNRLSFALHLVGILACFVVAPTLLVLGWGWLAGGAFVAGYLLQFLGHWVEGSRSGEGMLIRRLLGRNRS